MEKKIIRHLSLDDIPLTKEEFDYYYRKDMGYPVNEEEYLLIEEDDPRYLEIVKNSNS